MRATVYFIIFLFFISFTNAEEEWVQKHYLKNEIINHIECVDSNHCYAFAYQLTVVKIYLSRDQGNHWDSIYRSDRYKVDSLWTVYQCQALDSNHFYMTYNQATAIDKSTDGGQSFERVTLVPQNDKPRQIESFKMYNKRIGILTSINNVFVTKDNWKTFQQYENSTYKYAGGTLFFLDSNTVIMKTSKTAGFDLVKYDLNTNTWSSYYNSKYDTTGYKYNMYNMYFINDSTGFACGDQEYGVGNFGRDLIWKTTDRGLHWEMIHNDLMDKTFSTEKIRFIDENVGMAVGTWNKMISTTDGGKSWNYYKEKENIKNFLFINLETVGQYFILSSDSRGLQRYESIVSIEDDSKDSDFNLIIQDNTMEISGLSNNHLSINLKVYDVIGHLVLDKFLPPNQSNDYNIINIFDLPKGIYLYSIITPNKVLESGKFFKR